MYPPSSRAGASGLRLVLGLMLTILGARTGAATELGIVGRQFTLNGAPTFLLGLSYYGALGASEETMRRDLDEMQRHGFNWIRVWATWSSFEHDVSAVDGEGRPRQEFLSRLQWLVGECDRRGMVVDVTLSRGNGVTGPARLQMLEAHQRAVKTLAQALAASRNWYLDLANERNVRDRRFVSIDELRQLRDVLKGLDARRLVTASDGGDISSADLRDYLLTVKLDFVCPHRPREEGSPAQTEAKSREYLARMKELGREVPLHYQEPFRRGYANWKPKAEDFLTDLRGAKAGGAAGWCFHNGDQRNQDGGRPRRSFDLREERLFTQFDAEERKLLGALAEEAGGVRGASTEVHRTQRPSVVWIAVLQAGLVHSQKGNPGPQANFALFAQLARQAAASRPSLICFPEYAISGWPYPEEAAMNALAEEIPGDGLWYSRYCDLAESLGVPLLCTLIESAGGKFYNTAFLLDEKGQCKGKYRKVHANLGEQTWWGWSQGDRFELFELDGVRYGVSLCADMWFPETVRCQELLGADVVLHLSIGDDMGHLIPARAFDSRLPIVAAIFQGGSYAVDAEGKSLGKLPADNPGWKTFLVHPFRRSLERKYGGVWDQKLGHQNLRNLGAYEVLLDPTRRPPWTKVFLGKEGEAQTRGELLQRFRGRYDARDPATSTNAAGSQRQR